MQLVSCVLCGNAFDYDAVTPGPGRHCPNAACRAPLDSVAVSTMSFEATNPAAGDRDDQRSALKEQARSDVERFRAQLDQADEQDEKDAKAKAPKGKGK